MREFATALLLLPVICFLLPVSLYLLVLTVAAPFGADGRRTPATRLRRFAILVPAHNEEQVIGRLLENLCSLDYPRDLYDVCVVADNCIDATADIARGRGALVFERTDQAQRAKGFALNWLLDRLRDQQVAHDAYIVVDADSVLSANFLTVMNARLEAGAVVLQAYYGVLKLGGGKGELLREAALALVHFLRPAAKMALGASCGLKGNGMCFDRKVVDRFGLPAAGLAEDVEFHLALVSAGLRVEFAPESTVRAEMPASLRASRTQNLRWEAGRLAAARGRVLPLLMEGLRFRSIVRVDAALEQLVPPLSVPVLLAALLLTAGIVLRAPAVWFGALLFLAVVSAYVACGLVLARVPGKTWLALLTLPRYVLWKGLLYLTALLTPSKQAWVRTPHGRPIDSSTRTQER